MLMFYLSFFLFGSLRVLEQASDWIHDQNHKDLYTSSQRKGMKIMNWKENSGKQYDKFTKICPSLPFGFWIKKISHYVTGTRHLSEYIRWEAAY